MKKSTQWDIVGIFALILGLIGFLSLALVRDFNLVHNKVTLDTVLFAMTNPFLIALFFGFCFLSFAFGFYENKKEEQKNPT